MDIKEYVLPDVWVKEVAKMHEFAMGGTQVSIRTHSGVLHKAVIISNCQKIIAMKDNEVLPFSIDEIDEIFQTEADKDLNIKSKFKEEPDRWFFWGP